MSDQVNFKPSFDWEKGIEDLSIGDIVKVNRGHSPTKGKVQWINRAKERVSVSRVGDSGYMVVDIDKVVELIESINENKPVTEENYRDYPAINQSMLGSLREHPSLVLQQQQDTEYSIFGSLVDDMAFNWNKVDEKYHMQDAPSLSSTIEDILDDLFDYFDGNFDHVEDKALESKVHDLAEQYGYGQSWNDDTVIRKVLKEGGVEYLSDKIDAEGKTVVDKDTYKEARNIVMALKQDDYVSKYFVKNSELPDQIDIFHQLPIIFRIPGHEFPYCKALLDICIVNHKSQTIYPVDLKTSSTHIGDFRRKFKKFGYYIQAAWYTDAVRAWGEEPEINSKSLSMMGAVGPKTEIDGYDVANFRFIVVSRKTPTKPVSFIASNNDLKVGRHGGVTKTGEEIRGYRELFEDLKWHVRNEEWDHPREFYEPPKGTMKLDVFN